VKLELTFFKFNLENACSLFSDTLLFDNTYSVVRPKTLQYMVTLDSAEDSDEDESTDM